MFSEQYPRMDDEQAKQPGNEPLGYAEDKQPFAEHLVYGGSFIPGQATFSRDGSQECDITDNIMLQQKIFDRLPLSHSNKAELYRQIVQEQNAIQSHGFKSDESQSNDRSKWGREQVGQKRKIHF